MTDQLTKIEKLLKSAKSLAKEYRKLTGKPLGITGEIAEVSAARLLGLDLTVARQAGYDATCQRNRKKIRVQIKGRCLLKNCKPGQRVGGIKLDKPWDVVVLVLMNEDFEVQSIYEASRPVIEEALKVPGSKARNERGALSVEKFKSLAGVPIWCL